MKNSVRLPERKHVWQQLKKMETFLPIPMKDTWVESASKRLHRILGKNPTEFIFFTVGLQHENQNPLFFKRCDIYDINCDKIKIFVCRIYLCSLYRIFLQKMWEMGFSSHSSHLFLLIFFDFALDIFFKSFGIKSYAIWKSLKRSHFNNHANEMRKNRESL